jgi:hypothetical protein
MSRLEEERPVLEGLDQIEWHTLEHAYGEADDVPALLRSMASQGEETSGTALGALSLSICHQGTVYSASAYTVPFLIELLTSEVIVCKDCLLTLLAHLAGGDAYHRQHLHIYPEARRQDPSFQRELAEQVFWVERTREAVHKGLNTYLELLSYPDPKVRMSAAYILAQFKEDAATTVPLLRVLLEREDDQRAKASMILSLGALSEPSAENLALLEVTLRAEEGNTLIRLVAATALAWMAGEETPHEAIRLLVDMLTRPRPTSIFDVYVELPWVDGSLSRFARRTLRWRLPRERVRFAVPQLIEAIERVDAYDVGNVIGMLLYLTFGHEKLPGQIRVQDLTEEQREVLSAIAKSHAAWHTPLGVYTQMGTWLAAGTTGYFEDPEAMVVINDDLLELGLPEMQKDLQDFLNSAHEETH